MKHAIKDRICQQENRKNYLRVCLSKQGVCKWKTVHRLVAETFIPNPDNKPQVNHIDGNKQNNNIQNLEWVTNKENCRHAILNDIYHKRKNKKIVQLTLEGEKIKTWDLLVDIQETLGIDKRLVWRCCRGQKGIKQAKGYIWKYEEDLRYE